MEPLNQWWITVLSALDPVASGDSFAHHKEVEVAVLSLAIVAMVNEEGIDQDRAEKRLSEDGIGIRIGFEPGSGELEALLTWPDGGSFVMNAHLSEEA